MDNNEEYLLQWKSHNSEIVNEFHNLCKDEQFTDCTIAAEEETFKAHKLILSACSPYFKSLFAKTPCQHPVIFLKDIASDHIAQLLKYMYLGQISVKREDLPTILETANSLRIRGLTTDSDDKMRTQRLFAELQEHHDHHNNNNNNAPPPPPLVNKEGRKGYVPKKLRSHPNGDADSVESVSPARASSEGPMEPEPSGVSPDNGGTPEGSEGSPDEEQPWNLSQNKESLGKARFPILGNYLKNGTAPAKKARTGSIDDFIENIRNNAKGRRNSEEVTSNGANNPAINGANFANGWLDQIANLQSDITSNVNNENANNNTSVPLQDTLGLSGIDIAERIRAMAGPYGNWLNSAVAVSAAAAVATSTAVASPAGIHDKLSTPPPPATPPQNKDGSVGANGKPSVTCEICGKKLADPSSLYRHRKIHSGDKPHKCPFCSRRFIQRYNMKQHMKTHRIERMENPELAAAMASEYSLPRMTKNV